MSAVPAEDRQPLSRPARHQRRGQRHTPAGRRAEVVTVAAWGSVTSSRSPRRQVRTVTQRRCGVPRGRPGVSATTDISAAGRNCREW